MPKEELIIPEGDENTASGKVVQGTSSKIQPFSVSVKKYLKIFALLISLLVVLTGAFLSINIYLSYKNKSDVMNTYKNFIVDLRSGNVDGSYNLLAPNVQPTVTKAELKNTINNQQVKSLINLNYRVNSLTFDGPNSATVSISFPGSTATLNINALVNKINGSWKITKYNLALV